MQVCVEELLARIDHLEHECRILGNIIDGQRVDIGELQQQVVDLKSAAHRQERWLGRLAQLTRK